MITGIRRIRTTRDAACFVVDGDVGLTLVDVGWKSAPTAIAEALGPQLRDIRRIVVSHAHPDHVRGLAELAAETGAQVLVHRADAGWLANGRVPRGGRSGAIGGVLDAMPLLHWSPVIADVLLEGGELLDGGLRVIHAPATVPATSCCTTSRRTPCYSATPSSTDADCRSGRLRWPPTRSSGRRLSRCCRSMSRPLGSRTASRLLASQSSRTPAGS